MGMVHEWQDLIYEKRFAGIKLDDVDFVKVADACGVYGSRVEKRDELMPALIETIRQPGPSLLDVMIKEDEHVFPMVPAGGSFKKMLLSKDKVLEYNPSQLMIKI